MSLQYLKGMARGAQDRVVQLRRDFHRVPETRWLENITGDMIRKTCQALSSFRISEFAGGIWADYTVDPGFDRILFRADIDALPVQEKTGLPYASTRPGFMHACGHDTHIAMLLGTMEVIQKGGFSLKHNLRFVFQRAEENPGTEPVATSGGESLIRDNVLNGISQAYALHIWATGKPGVFLSRPGALLGNSGRLKINLHCSGGHAAKPHTGVNALRITHTIQNSLASFVARHLPPQEPTTLEPVILKAGTASNVLAQDAEMWYAVRTMLPRDEHNLFMATIEQEVRYIVAQFGDATVSFERILGHPALINDPISHRMVSNLLTFAGEAVEVMSPELGGEDFAHYLYNVPGSMWMLGAETEGAGDHHADTFNPDESVFWKGVLFWLLLATN